MMPLLLLGVIPSMSFKSHKGKGYVSESEYLTNDWAKLQHIRCPKCGEVGFFSKGYYFRCGACINYFDETSLAIENGEVYVE